jgi:integrase
MQAAWREEDAYIRQRARALVWALIYSGLRVGDVAQLRRAQLEPSGHLVLRVEKTGVPLKVLLHADAIRDLESLPANGGNTKYFFWTGRGKVSTITGSLRRTIDRLGKLAGVHAHPHRFRDTFAVELLTQGADIRTVQKLLGHESVRTTELHYAHFVKAHQDLLDRATATLDFRPKPARPLLVKPVKNRRRNA